MSTILDLSDDEQALVAGVDDFNAKILSPAIGSYVQRHTFPADLVREFASAGFMGTAYDQAFGGAGLGVRGAALVTERLAEIEPGFAAIYLCNSAPMTVIARFGDDEQKSRWLGPLCRGEFIASFGVTEAHGGSDVASIRTRSVAADEDYLISGSKMFSTNAGTPLHGISTVIAVTDPEDGPRGLTTFIVPVGTSGFTVGAARSKIGWRIADSVELHFDRCRVPASNRVGQPGDGLRQILATLAVGRVLVAAAALGLARKALKLAVAYAGERSVGGVSIMDRQGVAFPLADIATRIHAAELMVRHAAAVADARTDKGRYASMAKLFASELAMDAVQAAIQVHGGYGVFEEYEVAGLLGEAKVLQIVEGTSEIQRVIISRELV